MEFQLKSCVWEITLACCFSCKYCGSKGGYARKNELTTQECLQIASQLVDLGCRRVSLIGGEVFMRPDWDVIAEALSTKGVRVNIITNGYLFSEDIIKKLKTIQIESVSVSVDGPAEIHDKYRQPGSFERAERAVRILTQNEIPVSVISTINGENVAYLEAFYQQIKEWPVFAWQLQACSPMGNAANNVINFTFRHNIVLDFLAKHLADAPFSMGVADNIGYFTDMEGFLRGNLSGKAIFSGCRAGLTSIGIDSVGNVRGCESMYDERFNEGNLREKSLREIWESPDAFAYNRKFSRDMLTGKCGECQYGKYCAGGCRSYNFFVHGKLYESPRCARVF